jgi:hypothetical protein
MSYATAPTFEGNRLGVRRLSALGNAGVMLGGLGAVADTANVLVQNGWDQSLVNGLLQAGASDAQLTDLLNGATDVQTILMQLKAAQSGGINPAVAPPPPVGAGPIPVAIPGVVNYSLPAVPQGSTLLYQVSYTQTLATFANLTLPASSVQAQIASLLSQYGMAILQSSVTDNGPQTFGITFSIRVTGNGFGQIADAQSILHSLMVRIVGNTITSERMSLVSSGPLLSLPGDSSLPSASTFFTNYWPYLLAGAFAFYIVGTIGEKRI